MDHLVLGLAWNSSMRSLCLFPNWNSQSGSGRPGGGTECTEHVQSGCFHNAAAHRGCRLRWAGRMLLILSPLVCSLVQYFGFLTSLVPLLDVTSLCSVRCKFPPVLPVTLQFISEQDHCLCTQPFFFLSPLSLAPCARHCQIIGYSSLR